MFFDTLFSMLINAKRFNLSYDLVEGLGVLRSFRRKNNLSGAVAEHRGEVFA
jgi:hypothetical protein